MCLCAWQALLSDIASKEQEVQKISATAQQYQQAVKVRTAILPVGELKHRIIRVVWVRRDL